MEQILVAVGGGVALLGVAWSIGGIHISLVGSKEVGQLTPERFKERINVYGIPVGSLIGVLGTFGSVIQDLPVFGRVSLAVLASSAGAFGLLVLGFSYLEAYWYHTDTLPVDGLRRRAFKFVSLPMLYSSLYLYWFALVPAWLIFIIGLVRHEFGP
jgi:hypothetical protein